MIEAIVKAISDNKLSFIDHHRCPDCAGIYAFMIDDKRCLPEFNLTHACLYVGIAKHSLRDRDMLQHFKEGQTGRSTLRRSFGAILKSKLDLKAIPRGAESDSKRFINYKFTQDGEAKLSAWMRQNLQLGYWVADSEIPYQELRNYERDLTIHLKPALDLDIRTRRFNSFAEQLFILRKACETEAKLLNSTI